MTSVESNIAEIYYSYINGISSKQWWQFIRILGLPESDIDELFYDASDLTEQKYQMLSRWKNYYGYKKTDQEIKSCLDLAYDEITGAGRQENLTRKLEGHAALLENRNIARKFYEIMREINQEDRLKFFKMKLKVPETEIGSISADYSSDVDEQCYQMFLAWKRRSRLQRYAQIKDTIEKFLEEFKGLNAQRGAAALGSERFQSASSDVGPANRGFQDCNNQPQNPDPS